MFKVRIIILLVTIYFAVVSSLPSGKLEGIRKYSSTNVFEVENVIVDVRNVAGFDQGRFLTLCKY